MKKIIFLLVLLFVISFNLNLPSSITYASEKDILSESEISYQISENGVTTVEHKISLTNNKLEIIPSEYRISIKNSDIKNPSAFDSKNNKLDVVANTLAGGDTDLVISISNPEIGIGKKTNITLTYDSYYTAQKIGEVWEITIPKYVTSDNREKFSYILSVPASFGSEAYISPKEDSKSTLSKNTVYYFNNLGLSNGITAAFGEFQVYSFDITYHVENPINSKSVIDVALPPDTSFQKVIFESIDPKPERIDIDVDGNYLAIFSLKPRERLDIYTKGYVQTFSSPRDIKTENDLDLSIYLKPDQYWESDSQNIRELSKKYNTPKSIYEFVKNKLKYNFSRVAPNVQRKGALDALNTPNDSICMEYTDLFIAIARAAGIPTREVNGYAYSDNSKIQPLSLVADILHSWPEYWDSEKEIWIAVDPTWGSTSGKDYFSKLDLSHITFAIHGHSSIKPFSAGSYKLGNSPQKDVYINLSTLPAERYSLPQISFQNIRSFPFSDMIVKATVANPGLTSIYNDQVKIFFDGAEKMTYGMKILPPFSKKEFTIKIPFSLFGKTTPGILSIVTNNKSSTFNTYKSYISTTHYLIFTIVIFSIVIMVYIHFHRK